MIDINKGEILSPVGNTEMLYAAVRSGADAIYLGAKDFSARRNAENFTLEELAEVICYCHIRGVRVYLALNILIKNSELPAAFQLAQEAYNLGIDGIIIQDLGLAKILHEKIPQLKLHASTQMSVHSPSALPLLKELGFTQVVLAREMSRKEINVLCEKAKELEITVEVFVHGALCMSVSGQCLLSAFLGSRSGNRGLCAGPCRLPFKVNGGTGYDLSLKDLSLLEYLKDLYSLGVRSFKIEGRMKRPEYVAAATAACRQALDKGLVDEQLANTLKGVFSRSGFTDGYYQNKLGKDMFGIRTKDDVLAADNVFPQLHQLYRNEINRVPISVKANIIGGEPISLTLTDDKNNSVTAIGTVPQIAQNKPLTEETAYKNLCKFGSTPYYDVGGGIRVDNGLFVPAGELNELRRKAVEMLDSKRSENNHKKSNATYNLVTPKEKLLKKPKIYVRIEDEKQIPNSLTGIDAVIFPLENNPENILKLGITVIADIPRGIVNEEMLAKRLIMFRKAGVKKALCGNLAAVKIAKDCNFDIIADLGLNITNNESIEQISQFGAVAAVISCEQSFKDISQINSQIPIGMVAYGKIPLMLFKNCPLKNGHKCERCDKKGVITDRLGTEFPIRCRNGYSELLNSVPLWLADKPQDLAKTDFIILYFTSETPQRVKEVISAYNNGSPPDIKHTRGLYHRGTI